MEILAAIVPCLCFLSFVCGIVLLSAFVVGGRRGKWDDKECPPGDML